MDHSWGYGSEQRLREENQDCHGVFEFQDFTLAVVCDGMGGHVGGAQASAIAVRTIHDTLRQVDTSDLPSALVEAVTRANLAIYEAARKNHRLMGMGTTVVAAAVVDETAYIAHVGDSRAYVVRQGQVRQLTRDHTMVNLFVDAELLTPEDAATHPEAHVLSRSLGVERTVDVEISDAIALEPDDLIFLCSDGVHGVITDWELGNVDWGAPHEGVQHVLDIVAAREGDDNATGVAVLLATSFEDVPPTPLPEPQRLEVGDASGATAVPLDDVKHGATIIPDGYGDDDDMHGGPPPIATPRSDMRPARPSYEPPAADGSPAGYSIEGEPEPAPMAIPDMRKRSREPAEAPQQAGGAQNQRRVVLVAALGLVVFLGLGVTVAAVVGSSMATGSGDPGRLDPDPGAKIAKVSDPEPVQVLVEEPQVAPPVDEDPAVFRPHLPEAPRRLPNRPVEYTQPPPGGQMQWEAVQAARNHMCAASLQAVATGMRASPDHATLYSQAWFCFNETHQRPLAEANAKTWEDLTFLMVHFDGPPEKRAELSEEIKRLPTWFQPAVDGIEYRLEAWQASDQHDQFSAVMIDLLGEPTVADHLARDLLLEGELAVGLSKVESPNDRVIDWWARRVYIVSSALNGKIGRLVEAHRPEVVPKLREMLVQATADKPPENPDDKRSKPTPVPKPVKEAFDVGMGLADKPDPTKPKKTGGPIVPKEPTLDDLDVPEAVIHRAP